MGKGEIVEGVVETTPVSVTLVRSGWSGLRESPRGLGAFLVRVYVHGRGGVVGIRPHGGVRQRPKNNAPSIGGRHTAVKKPEYVYVPERMLFQALEKKKPTFFQFLNT